MAQPRRIAAFVLLPIGDTLFCTPALHALRLAYPQATIHALVFPNNRAVLESSPDLDGLIGYPTRQTWGQWGLGRLAGLYRWLHQQKYDLVVEFCPAIGWLTLLTTPRRRAWAHYPPLWWLLPDSPRAQLWRSLHAVQIFNRALELDLGIAVPAESHPRLHLRPADHAAAAQLLHRLQIVPERELVITMHPGGEGVKGQKRWPSQHFAALADLLIEQHGARVLLVGGAEDSGIATAVIGQSRLPRRIVSRQLISLVGQAKLLESAAVLERSRLFIGNDSGPLHMAATRGTSVLGIYGPTSLHNYRPYLPEAEQGHTWQVLTPTDYQPQAFFIAGVPLWKRAMETSAGIESISPATALAAAAQLLAAGRERLP